MTRDEVKEAIERVASGSTLGLVKAPTDEQIRLIGERAALAILQSDPAVESVEYDHATQSIRVRLTAEALGFPVNVTIGSEEAKP